VAAGELADGGGDDQAGHEPDGESALARGHVADSAARGLRCWQQDACVLEQGRAGRGEARGPVIPFEKLHLQLVFQRSDLARQHGLRDVQRLRGAAEVQVLGDGGEVAHLAQVQVHGASR
jgi:hypothetical protein